MGLQSRTRLGNFHSPASHHSGCHRAGAYPVVLFLAFYCFAQMLKWMRGAVTCNRGVTVRNGFWNRGQWWLFNLLIHSSDAPRTFWLGVRSQFALAWLVHCPHSGESCVPFGSLDCRVMQGMSSEVCYVVSLFSVKRWGKGPPPQYQYILYFKKIQEILEQDRRDFFSVQNNAR